MLRLIPHGFHRGTHPSEPPGKTARYNLYRDGGFSELRTGFLRQRGKVELFFSSKATNAGSSSKSIRLAWFGAF